MTSVAGYWLTVQSRAIAIIGGVVDPYGPPEKVQSDNTDEDQFGRATSRWRGMNGDTR